MIGKIADDLDKFQNQVAIKYRKGEITGLINNKTNLKQKDPQVMYKSAFSDILSTIAI
jgi:hypothetical protein